MDTEIIAGQRFVSLSDYLHIGLDGSSLLTQGKRQV